ncbi:unnamed protein product [Trichobilharzia szidati]|nr:unnamed protein product [Trichobilharzia szidati]
MRETPIINTAPPQPDDNDDDAADGRKAKSTKLEISKVPVVMDNLTLAKTDTRADTPVIEFKTVDSPFDIRIKPMEVLQATGKSVSQTFGDDDELDEIKHPETSDIHLPEMFTLNEYEDKCEVKELTTTRGEDEEEHCQQMKHEKESPPTTNPLVVCVLVQVQQTPDTIIMRNEDDQMLTNPDELKQSYSLMDNEEEEEEAAEGEIVQTEGVDITDYYLQSPLEDKITTDKEDEEEPAYHDIKVNQYHKTNVTTKFNLTVNHFDVDDKMFSCSQSGRDIQPPTDLSSETQRLPSPLSPSSSSSSEVVDHHEIMQRQEDQEEAEEDPTMKRHFTQLKEDVNILKITSKCTYTSTPLKNYSLRQRTTTTRIPSSSFERSTSPQEYTVASTVCLPHSDGTTTANTTTTTLTHSESPYPATTSSPSMTNLGWLLDSSSCLISRFDERLNKHLIEVSPNNRIFKKATITETSHHQLPTITATDQSPSQEQTTTTTATPPTTNRPEGNQLRITISQSIRRNYSCISKDDSHTDNLVSSTSNVITATTTTTTGYYNLRRSLSEDFKGDKHTTSHSEIKKPTSSLALVDEESEEMYIARKLTNEALNKAIGKLSIGYTDIPSPPPPALSYSTQITQKKNKETQQQQQQKFSDEEEEIITRLRQEYNIQLPSRIIDQHHRSTQSPLTIIMSTTPEDTTAPTPTTSIDTPFKIEQDVYSEVSKQTIAIHAKTRIYMFEADEGETNEEAQGEEEAKEEEMKDTDVYPVNDANVIQSISQECSLNKTDNQVVLQTSLLVTSPKYLTQLIDEEITDLRVEQQHIGVISGSDYSTLAKYSPMNDRGNDDDDDDNNREVENLPRLRERQELQQQQPQQQSPDGKTVTISPTSVVDDYMPSEDNDDQEKDEGKSTQQQIQEELSALSFAAPSTHEFSGPVKKRGSDDRTQNDQPIEEEEEQEDFTRPPDYVLTQTYQEISATDAITISQSADHPINDDDEEDRDILSRLTTPPPPPPANDHLHQHQHHQQQLQEELQSRNAIKSETITQDFVTIYETPEKIQLVRRSGTPESRSRQELIEEEGDDDDDDRYRSMSRPFTTTPTTTTTAEILGGGGGEKFKLTNIHEKDTPPPPPPSPPPATLSHIHSDNDEGMLQVSMDIDIQANYKLVNSTSELHDKEEPITNLNLHLPTTTTTQENILTLHEVITSPAKQHTSTPTNNKINASEKASPLLITTAITALTPESTSEKQRDGMLTGLKEMPTAMLTSPMEIQTTTDRSQLSINPQVTCTNLFSSIISIQIKLTQGVCKSAESHSEAIQYFDDTEIKSKSEQQSALLLPKSIDNTTTTTTMTTTTATTASANTTTNQLLSDMHFNLAVREHIDLMTRMSDQERQALVTETKKRMLKDASLLSDDDERIKLTAVAQAIQWIADMTDDQRQQILACNNPVDFRSDTPPPFSEKVATENQVFLPSSSLSVDIADKHHSHMNTPHELQWSTVEANYTQSIETTSQVDSRHTYDLVQRDATPTTTTTNTPTTNTTTTAMKDQHSSRTVERKKEVIEQTAHLLPDTTTTKTTTTAKQMYSSDTSKRRLPQLPLSSSVSPSELNQKQLSKYPIQKLTRTRKSPLDTLQYSDLHKPPINNMEERQPQQHQQRPIHSDYSLRINKIAQQMAHKIYPSNQATTTTTTIAQSSLCSPRSIIQTIERVQRAEKVANALDALIIETIDYITKNLHKK